MSSLTFYKDLKNFSDPEGVADLHNYADVPEDWVVVITDVRGSTKAIEEGRYKDVNMVGASCIVAVLNALQGIEIPYVFGGDGASLLIPAAYLSKIKTILASVQYMAHEEFALDLRVGGVSIQEIYRAGFKFQVAKYSMSPDISIAVMSGGGIGFAESLVKAPNSPHLWKLNTPDEKQGGEPADFQGLECRWTPLKSQKGVVVSAIIKADSAEIYKDVIQNITELVGGHHNLRISSGNNLKTHSTPQGLRAEQKVRTHGKSPWQKSIYLFSGWVRSLIGRIFFRFNMTFGGVNWGQYKQEVIHNTDFWKYDDVLRFVADLTREEEEKLQNLLESFSQSGKIRYGLHFSDSALMTCLVFSRLGNHVHFVDGNNGGYALAASHLKKKREKHAA